MKNARDILKDRVLLFDGGMGTYYHSRPGLECEQANLADPDGILALHREYLAAGAEAIKTNTFSLPRMAAAHAAGWQALAREGWNLAVTAAERAGGGAAVFADLGPAPDTEADPAAVSYKAVAGIFLEMGAENFLFETLSTDAGVAEAAAYIKGRRPDAFILVSFAALPDGYTRSAPWPSGWPPAALWTRWGSTACCRRRPWRRCCRPFWGRGCRCRPCPTAATPWWGGTGWSTGAGPTTLPRKWSASGSGG